MATYVGMTCDHMKQSCIPGGGRASGKDRDETSGDFKRVSVEYPA